MDQPATENPLVNYLNERFSTLKNYMVNTLNAPTDEDIHQLRVEIKKLNALIRMLKLSTHDTNDQQLFRKTLSKIFRSAGKLREDHINIALADEYGVNLGTAYAEKIEKKTNKHSAKLDAKLEHFLGSGWEELQQHMIEIADRTDQDALKILALHFLNEEFNTITNLLPEKENEKVLHKIRMHLKASGYVISMLSGISSGKDLEDFYTLVKTTESMIGSWHDHILFRQLLQKLIYRTTDQHEIKEIESALHVLQGNINHEVGEIYNQLSITLENNFVMR